MTALVRKLETIAPHFSEADCEQTPLLLALIDVALATKAYRTTRWTLQDTSDIDKALARLEALLP